MQCFYYQSGLSPQSPLSDTPLTRHQRCIRPRWIGISSFLDTIYLLGNFINCFTMTQILLIPSCLWQFWFSITIVFDKRYYWIRAVSDNAVIEAVLSETLLMFKDIFITAWAVSETLLMRNRRCLRQLLCYISGVADNYYAISAVSLTSPIHVLFKNLCEHRT